MDGTGANDVGAGSAEFVGLRSAWWGRRAAACRWLMGADGLSGCEVDVCVGGRIGGSWMWWWANGVCAFFFLVLFV